MPVHWLYIPKALLTQSLGMYSYKSKEEYMARPRKKGLDYFPLDVDIFQDDKLFDVQNEYGPLGEIIYLRLLCLIYKHGYYYRFDSLDKLASMLIKSIGNRWARDKQTVKDVILYLAECNLFSSELMQNNVITSRGIQERYLKAMERNLSKIEEYSLLENSSQEGLLTAPQKKVSATETKAPAAETSDIVSGNPIKESKENKRKVNESISTRASSLDAAALEADIWAKYGAEPPKSAYNDDCDDDAIKPIDGIGRGVVMLSNRQISDLLAVMPQSDYEDYVKRLAYCIAQKGYSVRSHYNTICRWHKEDTGA